MRLRTDIFVSALRRSAQAAGAFITIGRKGSPEAGAMFVAVNGLDRTFDLYSPAPQSVFDDAQPGERRFSLVLAGKDEAEIRRRLEQEVRFDPDLWLIDIEDRQRRAFVDVAEDPPSFTRR